MPSLARRLINANRKWSAALDARLPKTFRVSGSNHFRKKIVPTLITDGMLIFEIGGGSRPFLKPAEKADRSITVYGVDIDAEELRSAPPQSYDKCIEADLNVWRGEPEADLVICRSVLEHVESTEGAIRAIASTLKPGGTAAVFMPCRNALFARINLLLPQGIKKWLLFTLLPEKDNGHNGFPVHYDRCTPSRIAQLAAENGLSVVSVQTYWTSDYFGFFFPLHALWRGWTMLARRFFGPNFCESFHLVMTRD